MTSQGRAPAIISPLTARASSSGEPEWRDLDRLVWIPEKCTTLPHAPWQVNQPVVYILVRDYRVTECLLPCPNPRGANLLAMYHSIIEWTTCYRRANDGRISGPTKPGSASRLFRRTFLRLGG